jgi:dTDP-4-dehydrorhamnose reductase
MNNYLITGGSGRLGTELKKWWPDAHYPTHEQLDITEPIRKKKYDLIVHCAGYTNVTMSKQESKLCYDINVNGTKNLLKAYKNTPFVYISTEYAVNPTTYYSETKQLAEREVVKHPNHLIIRTLFKPRPYPFDRAFYDQYTMGDYVDVIAELIVDEIIKWDRKSRLVYIGTGRKSIYDLAKQTRPDVKRESVDVISWVKLPKDYI